MIQYLIAHGLPAGAMEAVIPSYEGPLEQNRIRFPLEKPPAMVTIDDRAITFTGEWPDLDDLKAFKPWNKR